ncbi:MAG: peptidylprolyl isomerase, partial [Acetobacteraceae bacterium]|nr:peptidylprolyl isomerase [Acetobacteraceae bacterium]
MRRLSLLAAVAFPLAAQAQAPAPPAAPPTPALTPAPAAEDPVVARVDGEVVRMSDVMATAAEALPEGMRNIPPEALRSLLPPEIMRQIVDRTVTDRAMVLAARRAGLDQDAELRRRVQQTEENELRDALLRREVLPRVTDAAIRARYDREQQGRPAEEEVRARHILVPNEADARAALQEIQRGASFEEVARRRSTDPAARQGGDLGFFKRGDMVPEFAAAAFALQPGQVSPNPVRTQFGWHLIRVEERRRSTGPSFEEARDNIRQTLIQEEVQAAVERIRAAARIELVEQPAAPAPAVQADPPPRPAAPA